MEASWSILKASWRLEATEKQLGGILEASSGAPREKSVLLLSCLVGATEDSAAEGAMWHAKYVIPRQNDELQHSPRRARNHYPQSKEKPPDALSVNTVWGTTNPDLCVRVSYLCWAGSFYLLPLRAI